MSSDGMFDNSSQFSIPGRPGISGAVIFISSQELDREHFTVKFG